MIYVSAVLFGNVSAVLFSNVSPVLFGNAIAVLFGNADVVLFGRLSAVLFSDDTCIRMLYCVLRLPQTTISRVVTDTWQPCS